MQHMIDMPVSLPWKLICRLAAIAYMSGKSLNEVCVDALRAATPIDKSEG